MPIEPDQIDPDALKVVRRLTRSGFEAYLVGGCVRDLLVGRTPKDFDVATSATPNEVKALFRNCRIIGRRFRLAHVFFGSKIIETSTFRANPREVEGGDDEHEASDTELLIRRDNVFGTAEEDARRRDFTVNGLFYDVDKLDVIDYVGGLEDIARRTVRTIGDPQIRFREDPVRILRAVKFAARLDFDVDAATYQALLDHRGELSKAAPPRVLEEIYRLLRGGAARRSFELLRETRVLDVLIPEFSETVRRADPFDVARLERVLDLFDDRTAAGEPISNSMILCGMVSPFLASELYRSDEAGPDRGALERIESFITPLFTELRASRRDVERARQVLQVQRRLLPGSRRRGRVMSIVRRDWFPEALAVFELFNDRSAPEIGAELERWTKLWRDAQSEGPPPLTEEGAEGQESPQRRRRRRRRGGRRRRGSAEVGGMTSADLDPG